MFPDLTGKLNYIKYGRDFDIFRESEYKSDFQYIASGGISNRDYSTLVLAMKILEANHPALICKIATRPGSCLAGSLPGNVEFLFNIRLDRFGSFLEKSEFVVLPLLGGQLSAGHMTLLESMSLGKNIIVADIPSIRDYVDDDLVFFYKAGDASDLAQKIEYLYNTNNSAALLIRSEKLKNRYRSDYSFDSFLGRIANGINLCD